MKPTYKKTLSLTILIVIIAFFIYYIYNNFNSFKTLEFQNPWLLIPLVFITLFSLLLYGFVYKIMLEPFSIKLKLKEWFGLICANNFYNLITPFRGGMIARAVYLKKKYQFSYTNFLSTMVGFYAIQYWIFSFLGIVSLILIYLKFNIFNIIPLIIFLVLFLPLSLIIFFKFQFPKSKYKILNKFFEIGNSWNTIKGNKKIILTSILVVSCIAIFNLISTIILYHFVGINLLVSQALFLITISAVIGMAQITPGNLGIGEVVTVLSALVLGISPPQSLTVAIISRLVSTIILFILGPMFSYILLKKQK